MAIDKDSLQPVRRAVYLTNAQWEAIIVRLTCHYDSCEEHAGEMDTILARELEKQLKSN